MKLKFIYSAVLLMFLFYRPIFAQQTQWNSEPSAKAVKGIVNIASSIVSDSFTPMTHYNTGDLMLAAVPAYFDVNTAYDDPEIKGKDLIGTSIGIGGGYALSDRLMFYGIFSYMDIDGDLEGEFYGKELGKYVVKTDYSLYSFLTGVGFDLIGGNSNLSIPIYLGLSYMRYDLTLNLPSYSYSSAFLDYDLDTKVTGSKNLYGVTAAFAFSYKIGKAVKLTPYFLYNQGLNKPEVTGEVNQAMTLPVPGTINESVDITLDKVKARMIGLSASYISDNNLSFSVSAGGLLSSSTTFYNDKFLNGLNMMSIVFVISYTGNIN